MKRLSCFIVLIVFCLSIFAISVNPSMDGRAVVADSGIFPPGGYYGKAPGYLPGDTVVVTNHNNGFSIDVLILGTYDAYEGIAILLSPEAADKLNIEKGKDVYVKVQKKQPIPYEEAVATSRNKKPSQQQALDTDKDSRVLPGESEELVQNALESTKKSVVPEGDIELPYEQMESVENNVVESEPVNNELVEVEPEQIAEPETVVAEIPEEENSVTNTSVEETELPVDEIELAEIENEEVLEDDSIIVEIPQEEVADEQPLVEENEVAESVVEPVEDTNFAENEIAEVETEPVEEAEEVILAEPEEYVDSEEIDSPVFAEVVEQPEPIIEEPIVNTEDEVVLDDISNEDFVENDIIDSPVENEVAQVEPEEILEPELPAEDAEEVVLEDNFEDNEEDSTDVIPTEEIADEESPFVREIEDGYVVEYYYADAEESEPEEVSTEDETLAENSEVEEILIPEEEVALEEVTEENTDSEILDTEVLEEEPELAVLDNLETEKSENVIPETPKDIFSMIVGEELDEEIIEDVVLEEADPRLPEFEDLLELEESAEADMQITLDEPESEPVIEIAQVADSEKEETKNLSSLMKKENSESDEFKNTVSNFNDLPKVKNAKSKTYYIQIATVNKEENVAKIIDLHGKKYPVYVIKNPAKASYQVLVGPLNDDEYALVLARFKQTYKDAFLRVAK